MGTQERPRAVVAVTVLVALLVVIGGAFLVATKRSRVASEAGAREEAAESPHPSAATRVGGIEAAGSIADDASDSRLAAREPVPRGDEPEEFVHRLQVTSSAGLPIEGLTARPLESEATTTIRIDGDTVAVPSLAFPVVLDSVGHVATTVERADVSSEHGSVVLEPDCLLTLDFVGRSQADVSVVFQEWLLSSEDLARAARSVGAVGVLEDLGRTDSGRTDRVLIGVDAAEYAHHFGASRRAEATIAVAGLWRATAEWFVRPNARLAAELDVSHLESSLVEGTEILLEPRFRGREAEFTCTLSTSSTPFEAPDVVTTPLGDGGRLQLGSFTQNMDAQPTARGWIVPHVLASRRFAVTVDNRGECDEKLFGRWAGKATQDEPIVVPFRASPVLRIRCLDTEGRAVADTEAQVMLWPRNTPEDPRVSAWLTQRHVLLDDAGSACFAVVEQPPTGWHVDDQVVPRGGRMDIFVSGFQPQEIGVLWSRSTSEVVEVVLVRRTPDLVIRDFAGLGLERPYQYFWLEDDALVRADTDLEDTWLRGNDLCVALAPDAVLPRGVDHVLCTCLPTYALGVTKTSAASKEWSASPRDCHRVDYRLNVDIPVDSFADLSLGWQDIVLPLGRLDASNRGRSHSVNFCAPIEASYTLAAGFLATTVAVRDVSAGQPLELGAH
ncbi:MAG: hypothetical protein WD226_03535 [Planctomycetota bacterium]